MFLSIGNSIFLVLGVSHLINNEVSAEMHQISGCIPYQFDQLNSAAIHYMITVITMI